MRAFYILSLSLICACGIYTFSGSGLPAHIKTVHIPLFENRTMQPDIAEEMTRIVTDRYVADNRLKLTDKNAHSVLKVIITGYNHEPLSYDEAGNVREYRVTISASALFSDEKKSDELWKEENIICTGDYSADSGDEEDGRSLAMKQLADVLIENSISGW